jgi:hypothetical protein
MIRPSRSRILALILPALLALAAGCGTGVDAPAPEALSPDEARNAFFGNLRERCGDEYPGRAIMAPETDDVFHPAYLGMHIVDCSDDEISITFFVDDDDSRTWILERSDEGLLFTHEHRQADGSLYEISGWGGWANDRGTELFQHFPDHRWDPEVVPEERRSHWRLRLDPENGQFVYYLDRGVTPAYRLVFHMGQSPKVLEAHGL